MEKVHELYIGYSLIEILETNMTFYLKLWPNNLNSNRDSAITKDYLLL